MPHTCQYGQLADGTYAFSVDFKELPLRRIQRLLLDDAETEVTPDAWINQTAKFIQVLATSLRDGINDAAAIRIVEPTMTPEYAIRIVVDYSSAVAVQDKLKDFIATFPTAKLCMV